MEPTNYYWKLMATYLQPEGLPLRLVNPLTVNWHREGDQLDRAKDDWRDALQIADLLCTGKYTETQLRLAPTRNFSRGMPSIDGSAWIEDGS